MASRDPRGPVAHKIQVVDPSSLREGEKSLYRLVITYLPIHQHRQPHIFDLTCGIPFFFYPLGNLSKENQLKFYQGFILENLSKENQLKFYQGFPLENLSKENKLKIKKVEFVGRSVCGSSLSSNFVTSAVLKPRSARPSASLVNARKNSDRCLRFELKKCFCCQTA